MSITFINLFDVPADKDEDFLRFWSGVNVYMAAKPGYLSHRMHKALAPDATYRYANVVQWESSAAWDAAHDAGFHALVTAPDKPEFTSVPTLFELIHAGSVEAKIG